MAVTYHSNGTATVTQPNGSSYTVNVSTGQVVSSTGNAGIPASSYAPGGTSNGTVVSSGGTSGTTSTTGTTGGSSSGPITATNKTTDAQGNTTYYYSSGAYSSITYDKYGNQVKLTPSSTVKEEPVEVIKQPDNTVIEVMQDGSQVTKDATGKVIATTPPKQTQITPTTVYTPIDLSFRTGLTNAQKTSITNMLRNRATTPLNETDAKNLAYALGQTDYQQYVGKTSQQLNLVTASTINEQKEVVEGGQQKDYSALPDTILNSPDWKALPPEYKDTLYATFQMQKLMNTASADDALKALEEAKKYADPIMKEALRISQDELTRGIGSIEGDFQSKLDTSQRRIQEIEEDLLYNKDYLSLDEQNELANQLKQYKRNLYSLQQEAAESGLAFSSPRKQAEEELRSDYEGVVESTQRKYAKSQRDLAVGSQRDVTTLQKNIQDLERQKQEGMTTLQRKGEATLGSANMPSVPGVSPLGGVTGSIQQQYEADVINLSDKFRERQNPFTF